MKNIKVALFTLAMLCTLSGYAQYEFFGNNTGLSASYSQNFNTNGKINSYDIARVNQLSLYLKNGFLFSGEYSTIQNYEFYGASIGYLVNHEEKNEVQCLFNFSYGELENRLKIPSINIALTKVLFTNSNFPFSIGASSSMNVFYLDKSNFYINLQLLLDMYNLFLQIVKCIL